MAEVAPFDVDEYVAEFGLGKHEPQMTTPVCREVIAVERIVGRTYGGETVDVEKTRTCGKDATQRLPFGGPWVCKDHA